MDNPSSSTPEHDEKTGSFAPRTIGRAPAAPKPIVWWKRRSVVFASAVLAALAITVGIRWFTPTSSHTAMLLPRYFFLAIDSLNQEETSNGQGAAAEPPIEKRLNAERAFQAVLKTFPDLKGVITPCVLTGHDLHLVDPTGRILTHIMSDEEVPPPYQGVRDLFSRLPAEGEHVVILRGNRLEAYDASGERVVAAP